MSGHQFSTNSRIQTNDPCSAPATMPTLPHLGQGGYPLNEGADDRVGGRELHAPFTPRRGAGGDAALVESPRRILHEAHATATVQEPADRRVVTDVCGDAEDDDLVRVERGEKPVGV